MDTEELSLLSRLLHSSRHHIFNDSPTPSSCLARYLFIIMHAKTLFSVAALLSRALSAVSEEPSARGISLPTTPNKTRQSFAVPDQSQANSSLSITTQAVPGEAVHPRQLAQAAAQAFRQDAANANALLGVAANPGRVKRQTTPQQYWQQAVNAAAGAIADPTPEPGRQSLPTPSGN